MLNFRGFRYLHVVGQLLLVGMLYGVSLPAWSVAEEDLTPPSVDGAPRPVHVHLYIADIYEISGADQTFNADVFMIAEWTDPRLAGHWSGLHGVNMDDVWHPRLQLVNSRSVTDLLPHRLMVEPSGHVRYQQRWTGRFAARMNLRDFPLDVQRFHVQVVSIGYTREQIDLIADVADKRSGRAESLSITDWKIGPTRMQRADFVPAPGVTALPGVELSWEGTRDIKYYTVQVILPLIMIVLMGWTALWIEPQQIVVRMNVAITTMLTLIAYRFALGRLVPNLNYLTRFDYFTLGSTLLIFLTLMIVAVCAHLSAKDKHVYVRLINRWSLLSYPVLFAAMLLLVWWK